MKKKTKKSEEKKIYCHIGKTTGGMVVVYALAEDGVLLTNHMSSNITWAKHDIGITSDWKHDIYEEHFPKGYELVWLDKPKEDKGFQKAYKLYQEEKKVKGENMARVTVTIEDDEGKEHTITRSP